MCAVHVQVYVLSLLLGCFITPLVVIVASYVGVYTTIRSRSSGINCRPNPSSGGGTRVDFGCLRCIFIEQLIPFCMITERKVTKRNFT